MQRAFKNAVPEQGSLKAKAAFGSLLLCVSPAADICEPATYTIVRKEEL